LLIKIMAEARRLPYAVVASCEYLDHEGAKATKIVKREEDEVAPFALRILRQLRAFVVQIPSPANMTLASMPNGG
jgi:hypothetical protein